MANKRMFTDKITDRDDFLDMPLSTQALYFHLNMKADDDGFVNSPKRIAKAIGSSDDELKLLIMKRFIIGFENGVIVIKHFKLHNWIRSDRHSETIYKEELALLDIKDSGEYEFKNELSDKCLSDVGQMSEQYRLDKIKLKEVNINKIKESVFVSYSDGNVELLNALNDYETMRKSIKAPMTDRAKQLLTTELNKLKDNGQNIIECLNRSIVNNWKSVYAINDFSKNGLNNKPKEKETRPTKSWGVVI